MGRTRSPRSSRSRCVRDKRRAAPRARPGRAARAAASRRRSIPRAAPIARASTRSRSRPASRRRASERVEASSGPERECKRVLLDSLRTSQEGNYSMPMAGIVKRLHRDPARERRALVDGLLADAASIPPKYFYDRLGCALYGAICELPEYYPTRTERAIFSQHREAIAEAVGTGGQFIDLGAGDCCKGESWLPFLMPARYLAVDIAED